MDTTDDNRNPFSGLSDVGVMRTKDVFRARHRRLHRIFVALSGPAAQDYLARAEYQGNT